LWHLVSWLPRGLGYRFGYRYLISTPADRSPGFLILAIVIIGWLAITGLAPFQAAVSISATEGLRVDGWRRGVEDPSVTSRGVRRPAT
jgi:hypothetical protein